MADRLYLMRADDLIPAMAGQADNIEDVKCVTVLSANVESFESGLPTDQTRWISCDEADVIDVSGYQVDGIPLPPKVVRG